MKYKILILIIFSFILTYSQKVNNDTLTTKIDIPKSKTLTINLVNKTDEADIVAFDWEKNMPWIGAVLIGLLTVVANVIISRQSRKTSLKTINLQLNNNKEISLAQIETSKQTAQIEFNKTVLSGNRQTWINNLRDDVSHIISKLSSCSLQKKMSHKELLEIKYLITKVQFMLNPEKDKEFISSLNDIFYCTIEITADKKTFSDLTPLEKKLRNITAETLKTEWERVKRGE